MIYFASADLNENMLGALGFIDVSPLMWSVMMCYAGFVTCRLHIYKYRQNWSLCVGELINNTPTGLSSDTILFEEAMHEALARSKNCFEMRSLHLVILQPATWTVEATYSAPIDTDTGASFIQEFVLELRAKKIPISNLTLWRYHKSATVPYLNRRLFYLRRPLAIASIIVLHDQLAAMLVAECKPLHIKASWVSEQMSLLATVLGRWVEKDADRMKLMALAQPHGDRSGPKPSSPHLNGQLHEFNNLLTTVMGYAEMAADNLDPESSTHDYVTNIMEAGSQVQLLIADNPEVLIMKQNKVVRNNRAYR